MPVLHDFQPDFRHIVDAANNRRPRRMPLYDHLVNPVLVEELLGKPFWQMICEGDHADRVEGYRRYFEFGIRHGYDALPVEFCVTSMVQGGHALCGRASALFKTLQDVEAYPWEEIPKRFIERYDPHFRALAEALPPGMKAVGGIGNGVFETAQDFVPLMDLCLLQGDDPEAYSLLWRKVGDLFVTLWGWFLEHHADAFAVCRMGDDLGYRTSTMLSPSDIRAHIVPQYARVVALVHSKSKPFLLHSCGKIFDVMDDIISVAKIDAKHSNEDAIAPFKEWFERYGDRIGIFGGIDMDLLCRADAAAIRERTFEVMELAGHYRGFALGCGNSIAEYVPAEKYLAMVNAAREYRRA